MFMAGFLGSRCHCVRSSMNRWSGKACEKAPKTPTRYHPIPSVAAAPRGKRRAGKLALGSRSQEGKGGEGDG